VVEPVWRAVAKVDAPETVNDPSVPTLVSDEETTFEASVAPVSEPAGAEPVMFPVMFPVALVKKRLVVEAVVAKKLVVVALVPVAVVKVKFWRVEEAEARIFPSVEAPETVSDESVPTLVSDEARTFAASVAPVSVPAGATTAAVPAAVMRPLPLTVKVGMAVDEPNEPVLPLTVARVVPFPTEVTSPVKLALVVTVAALPPIERLAAVPVRPVPAPVNDEPVTAPVAVTVLAVRALMDPVFANRLVVEAVVAKKLVEVALVDVARVVMRSVRPFRVVKLLSVEVAARAVSNRP
jgi:hypothetical protein